MRYPIFIPSKGRWDNCKTARFLTSAGIGFTLVVEPQDADAYIAVWGEENILVLPWDDPGGAIHARNWIKDKAEAEGHFRHWQLDDDVRGIVQADHGHQNRCDTDMALSAIEEFCDRYTNVALAGPRHASFGRFAKKPFQLNNMIPATVWLIRSDLPYSFRVPGGESIDYCFQVLSGGWCTITTNIFQFDTAASMSESGGATEYFWSGGRLRRARELQRLWPGLVKVVRRNNKPEYFIGPAVWGKFDTPLELKEGIDLEALR